MMKKVYIFSLLFAIVFGSFAQLKPKTIVPPGKATANKHVTSQLKGVQADIWTNTCSTIADWTVGNNNTPADNSNWVQTTTGANNTGYCPLLVSTTAADGWLMFDSDGYGSGVTADAWIMNTNPIDCSSDAVVRLEFEQVFRQYAGSEQAFVEFSNNGTTWTSVEINTGLANNASTPNPDVQDLDISAVAGNQATVYIRFRYVGNWGYMWEVDDIRVYSPPSTDAAVTAITAPNNAGSCSLTATESVTVTIQNLGGNAISNFDVSYEINGAGTVTETVASSIAAGATLNYTFTATADLSGAGSYTVTAFTSLAGDANPANDSEEVTVVSADATITIELLTDAYASESAWYIYNSSGAVVATNGALTNETLHTTNVCAVSTECYSFVITDSYGDGIGGYGGSPAGYLTISYNGSQVGGFTTGESVFGTEWSQYGIGDGCAAVDAALTAITTPLYQVPGNVNIAGTIINLGTDNITTYDVVYSLDGGANSAAYTVTGVNLAIGESHSFTHNVPANMPNLQTYNVVVTVEAVNGVADENPADNTLDKDITIVPVAPIKKVFGEEGTGTWCGWCVRGHVFMEYMANTYPDTWIGVAVHNGDPMVVANYDGPIGAIISGYPSGLVDRTGGEFDPATFEAAYNDRINVIPPVAIDITNIGWDAGTRALTFDVEAMFVADLTGNWRLNAVIAENGVTGTTSGYNQVNYYSGGTYGPMGGYESLADPVPAADMVYDHVARAILGDWDGTAGSIPATVTASSTHSYTYSYTVPAGYDENNIEIIGLIIDQNTGEVMNATNSDIIVGIGEENFETEVVVYPNPARDQINVRNVENAEISVFNLFGQNFGTFVSQSNTAVVDLSGFETGTYVIRISNNNDVVTKKVMVVK